MTARDSLAAIHARYTEWYDPETTTTATWDGIDPDETHEHYIIRNDMPALVKALGDVLDVFDDQAVEGFGDTTAAVRIYRAITRDLSEVTT